MINILKLSIVFLCIISTNAFSGVQQGYDAAQRGDYELAYKIWKPLAEKGNKFAQSNLGYLYLNGKGVSRDYKEAVKWYTLSAEKDYPGAQFTLGYMYDEGLGVLEDDKQAVKWYYPAANAGNARAQYFLGKMYRNGGEGVSRDYKKALYWFNLAAEQADGDALFELGHMYYNGEGVSSDKVYALMWLEVANANGNKYALDEEKRISKEMTKTEIQRALDLARICQSQIFNSSNNVAIDVNCTPY